MANLAVVYELVAKDRASKEFAAVGDAAEKAGLRGSKAFKAMTVAATAVATAVGKFAFDSVKSAGEAEQAFGGVDAVFGKAAAAVEKYADTSATRLGLAGQDYATFASVVGAQLQRMGQSQEESAVTTDKLITLGADLAATFGGSVSDAVSAVGSLLRGERDPIERYAVGINEAAIKAGLAAKGLDGLKGAALEQAKAQVTLELLFKQTANAQGQSARESKTLQGQTQRLSAQYKDLTAEVGAKLLPVVVSAIEKFKQIARFTDEHRRVVIPLAAAIGGLTVAVLAINAATVASTAVTAAASTARGFFMTTTIAATGVERASTISRIASTVATTANTVATGIATVATKAWTVAQVALNFALRANPIGLVITAVAALAAGVVIAYQKSDTFRAIVQGLWGQIKTAAAWASEFFKRLKDFKIPGWVKELSSLFGGIAGGIKRGFDAVKGGFGDGVGFGGGFGGGGAFGSGGGQAKGQPPGVKRLMSLLPAGTPLISGHRPGARTPFGNQSYHAQGRAVDIPPDMRLFHYIRERFGHLSKELFFSPADAAGLNLHNGKPYKLKPRTKADHFDHIHWAMANGGVINEPVVGMGLQSGKSYAFGERGPETVTPGVKNDAALLRELQSQSAVLVEVVRYLRDTRDMLESQRRFAQVGG